nr:winged helix-turn-helix domain-containing protein [Deinococcus humi]
MRGEVSVAEVAKRTNIPVKQAHHRLTRLLEAGLIEVTGERQRGGRPIKLYRARATVYQVPFALTDAATAGELMTGMTQPYLKASMEAIGPLFMAETNRDVLVALNAQQHLSMLLVGETGKDTAEPQGRFGAFTQLRLGREARAEAARRMRELGDWLITQELQEADSPDAQMCIAGLFFTPGQVDGK